MVEGHRGLKSHLKHTVDICPIRKSHSLKATFLFVQSLNALLQSRWMQSNDSGHKEENGKKASKAASC